MAIADELTTLQDLHGKGNLTDAEFADAKATVLAGKPQRARSRSGIWVGLLVVLFALLALYWYQNGSKSTTNMIAIAVHAPIQIENEIENVPASSWKSMPFTLPYTGSVTLTLKVVHGNPIDVFIIQPDQLASLRARKTVSTDIDFDASKTETYARTAQLQQGTYYLVLRDTSLGILSASASDISIKMDLKP